MVRAGPSPVASRSSCRRDRLGRHGVQDRPQRSRLGPARGQEPLQVQVLRVVQQGHRGRVAVPARPADLLVVGVERGGGGGVHHEPDVRLVDAHPERRRRDHHVELAVEEPRVHRVAVGALHPGVVGRRPHAAGAQLLDVGHGVLAGGAVDQADPVRRALPRQLDRPLDDLAPPQVVVVEQVRGEVQFGAVEGGDDLGRVAQPQPGRDVGAGRGSGRRGQRDDRRCPSRSITGPSRR